MSLATRCTSCATVFRVVQDQLKVSEGWVRCGRCGEVFNALEGLLDLERDALPLARDEAAVGAVPQAQSTPAVPALPAAAEPAEPSALSELPDLPEMPEQRTPATDRPQFHEAPGNEPENGPESTIEAAAAADAALDEEIDAHLFGNRRSAVQRGAARGVDECDRIDFSDARFDSDLLPEALQPDTADDAPATEAAELPLEATVAPEFIRRAERQARWHGPAARATLGAAALLLAAMLVLQAGNHFRDLVAARWPAARPALLQWCALAQCQIEAPRRIGAISVESTALTRTAGLDALRLAVTLRNRSTLALAVPSVDLSLTDASGTLIARRALSPHDFHATAA